MAPNIPDHWLWLGLGVFTFIAIKQVSHGLQNIRIITEVHTPIRQPHIIPPTSPTHQEDAIKTSSLLTLATSHNTEIRSSATKILCTRFYASASAKKALVRDLNSKDDDVKHRAQLAFNLLCDMGVWTEYSLPPPTPRGAWRLLGRREWDFQRDAAERDLRRRRREAVVIHEGDGAVGREDVYMRDQEGRMSIEDATPGQERTPSVEVMLALLRTVHETLVDHEGNLLVREGDVDGGLTGLDAQ
ncbi:uncharacterized protein K460DRAFT_349096 [Cucurbitaria berberidis CBS 394.84]|uniref:Uncharacterized protein n=1 Tax=Cucurbitaria berberidis CBS 394.84 TaxID=1168544 RepID=A0A9P4G7N1_9PLEO|nr:uncharacterized protein K460DRAFT_349096 [Cucurbitaria berberidis CBS 394.84]KAF1840540.1 hypothetical protein K460DRAFT_349096 [Cucurbitaria berberidis CBS 394.84]